MDPIDSGLLAVFYDDSQSSINMLCKRSSPLLSGIHTKGSRKIKRQGHDPSHLLGIPVSGLPTHVEGYVFIFYHMPENNDQPCTQPSTAVLLNLTSHRQCE